MILTFIFLTIPDFLQIQSSSQFMRILSVYLVGWQREQARELVRNGSGFNRFEYTN